MVVPPKWKQVFYSLGAHSNMVSLGMTLAYSGTLLPALKDPNSQIKIDVKMASWIAAMPGLSGVIPALLLGPLMHYGGRKKANFALLLPVCFGWLLTYVAGQLNSISLLLTGRFFQGLCTGAPYFISVCVAEFSAPKMRSILLCLKPVFAVLGISVINFMAYVLDWKHLALVGAAPPIFGFFVTILWPETPEWLVLRGRYEEATVVFNSIRGHSLEGDRELTQLIESEKLRQSLNEKKILSDIWNTAKSRVLWKPISVLMFTVLLPTMGGRQYIPAYSLEICAQVSGDKSNSYFYTILGDIISIIAVFVGVNLIKAFRRRQILFGSGFVGIVLLVLCSVLSFMRTIYPDKILAWITLSVFGAYYFVLNSSLMIIAYVLMGEILPLEYRAIGSVIDGVLMTVCSTTIVWVMPFMQRSIGIHGVLLTFGSGMMLCLVYLYYELPETKNRTLHDIGDYFRGKSSKLRQDDHVVNIDERRSILRSLNTTTHEFS